MFKLGYCGLVDNTNGEFNDDFITSRKDKEFINNYTGNLRNSLESYTNIDLGIGEWDMLYIDNNNDVTFNTENGLPSEWGSTTALWAKFEGNLSAGNLDFDISELNYILIAKREATGSDNLVYEPVDIIKKENFSTSKVNIIYDRIVQRNKEYDYIAIPVLQDGTESTSLYAQYLTNKKVDWCGHYIFDGVSEWHCRYNTSLSWIRNHNTSVVNTLSGAYPYIVQMSQNNYDTITIGGTHLLTTDGEIIGNEDELKNSPEYNKLYDNFITNGKPKLIRDYSGRMWIASLNGNVEHSSEGVYYNISTTHTFEEIGDANNIDDLYQYGFTHYNSSVMVGGNIAEDVIHGATLKISVIDSSGNSVPNKDVSILLNNVEIWNCQTNGAGIATIANLDAGFYTIIIGKGVYAIKKYISINSSSSDAINVEVKVG